MKGTKQQKIYRRCAHCGRRFAVHPRLGRRHRFCSRPECAHASHLAAQKKWRRSPGGREYFKGGENTFHVSEWRKAHPGYGRRGSRLCRLALDAPLTAVLRELALQDSIDPHLALLIGLVVERSNLALQDTIAFEIRRLILLGHGILTQSLSPDLRPTAAPAPERRPPVRPP
jgi:hypothetical protein